MSITLSWDLFIMVFFSIIIAYSFIIGKNQTLQVIIATYIAILTSDALGNLLNQFLFKYSAVLPMLSADLSQRLLIVSKVAIFVIIVVVLAVRGGYFVEISEDKSSFVGLMVNFMFGFLSAGLMVSTILIYISGITLIGFNAGEANALIDIAQSSDLIRGMVKYYNFWFSLPAIAFIFTSLINPESKEG